VALAQNERNVWLKLTKSFLNSSKALTGILKGKVPDDITLWDAKYEYLKEKHGL
jgi:hypothetical protein